MPFIFSLSFVAFFIVFFIILFLVLFRTLREWKHNESSPRLTVPATIISKRTQIGHNGTHGMNTMSHTYTRYFVTFQFESGDRMELGLSGDEYGLLVEGDTGNLTFQGTRFLSFDRE